MSLADYSKLEGEIKNAPEPTTLKKGTEVKARIIAVRTGASEKEDSDYYGISYFSVVFDTPDEPLVKEFSDFFWDLVDFEALRSVSEKTANSALRHFRTFAEAFNIDFSRPFDIEDDLLGKEGWLIVGIKKSEEYGEQNIVQKYLAPNKAPAMPTVEGAPF
jgi:hypothetical protein